MGSIKDLILEAVSAKQMQISKIADPKRYHPSTKEMMYHYSAYHIGAGGTLKNRVNLNGDELGDFMYDPKLVNKTANIKVVRNDGNAVTYTHNGDKWVIVSKEKMQSGSKYIP